MNKTPDAATGGIRETAARGSVRTFTCPSFTDPGGVEWHPSVNLKTGRFWCDCPDWIHRRSKTGEPCKHVRAALASLEEGQAAQPDRNLPQSVKEHLLDFPLRVEDVLRAAISAVGLATVLDTIGELFGNAGQDGRRKRRGKRR